MYTGFNMSIMAEDFELCSRLWETLQQTKTRHGARGPDIEKARIIKQTEEEGKAELHINLPWETEIKSKSSGQSWLKHHIKDFEDTVTGVGAAITFTAVCKETQAQQSDPTGA